MDHFQAIERIAAGRLILRRVRASDAESIFTEYAQDPKLTRYLTWQPHKAVAETESFLAGCIDRWDAGTEFTWALTLAENDQAIGMLACRVKRHSADLGYVLTRRLWGQGLMSEALKAVVAWAMQGDRIFRVWALCDVNNSASAKVMEKAGLECEGLLRRWLVHPNISNEPRDCLVYSRVRQTG